MPMTRRRASKTILPIWLTVPRTLGLFGPPGSRGWFGFLGKARIREAGNWLASACRETPWPARGLRARLPSCRSASGQRGSGRSDNRAPAPTRSLQNFIERVWSSSGPGRVRFFLDWSGVGWALGCWTPFTPAKGVIPPATRGARGKRLKVEKNSHHLLSELIYWQLRRDGSLD